MPDSAKTWKPLRSEEHTSELQSPCNLVCRLLLEKKKIHRRYSTNAPVSPLSCAIVRSYGFFFFNDTATTEIYTLSLHDALPISFRRGNHQADLAVFKPRRLIFEQRHRTLAGRAARQDARFGQDLEAVEIGRAHV